MLVSLVAVTICILAVLVSLFIYKSVSEILRPVYTMIDVSNQLAAGHFDIPDIDYPLSNEMGRLVESFNQMKNATGRLMTAMEEKHHAETLLAEARARKAEQEQQLQEAVVLQLRSQIMPHFLFNTLNIISRTARVEGAPKTEELLYALAHLFRASLQSTVAGQVTLAEEINMARNYFILQQARFGSRVGLTFRVAKDVYPEELQVPSFFLQPLVENSILHGLENRVDGGRVRVRIQRDETHLYISICDNGSGMSRERLAEVIREDTVRERRVTGIGVRNVRAGSLWPTRAMPLPSIPKKIWAPSCASPCIWRRSESMIKILIAEDEALERKFLLKILADALGSAAELRDVENGLQAVELARLWRPDLLLLDIRMPGMTGLEAAEEIRTFLPYVRIALITAYGEFSYAQQAIRLHVSDYILKPVEDAMLISTVRRLMEPIRQEQKLADYFTVPPLSAKAPQGSESQQTVMERVDSYLRHNYALDISLERVADIIGASPGYFSKLFKQHFGQTFLERLTQIRIQQAKKLLRTTDKSTREIGEAVGYPSITYFNAKFKKETGLPPAEYRRNPPEE